MSRDWQKDMETVERFKYFQTLCHGIPMLVHGQTEAPEPVEVALEYWLQQYAAEKERADKAEEREKVLKHAFIVMLGYVPKTARVALDFDEVLDSLYPKEETKP